jgi:hypothetical protein
MYIAEMKTGIFLFHFPANIIAYKIKEKIMLSGRVNIANTRNKTVRNKFFASKKKKEPTIINRHATPSGLDLVANGIVAMQISVSTIANAAGESENFLHQKYATRFIKKNAMREGTNVAYVRLVPSLKKIKTIIK